MAMATALPPAVPSCSDPRVGFASVFHDPSVMRCTYDTGTAFLNTLEPIASTRADVLCSVASCRRAFVVARAINVTADCRLSDDEVDSIWLVRDVLTPLAASPQCARATDGSRGSLADGDDSDMVVTYDPSLPSSSTSSYSNGLGTATMVGLVLGVVGVLAIGVVLFRALSKDRRNKHQQQKQQEALDATDAKTDDYDSPHSSTFEGTAPLTSPVLLPKPSAPTASRSYRSRPEPSAPTASRTSMQAFQSGMRAPSAPTASRTSLHKPSAPTATASILDGLVPSTERSIEELLTTDNVLLARAMRADDIQDIRVIGSGGHGIVYLVRYRRTRLLAAKRLVLDRVTTSKMRAFIDEIKLVAALEHPCIVPFVGVAWTNASDVQALFEYMPNGDLCTYLAKTRPPRGAPTWDAGKLQIALDIIDALVYVHSFTPPLVHRDLKSRNVLLDADRRAKLSDFGVSRFQSDALTMTTGVGTSRWLAPEVINGGGEYNESCDVYSFGMVLVELDSHALPFAELRTTMSEMAMLQLVSEGKLAPTFSASCPTNLLALARRCLAFEPDGRPTALEVAGALRTIAACEFQYAPLQ